jgi:hypothetical protein
MSDNDTTLNFLCDDGLRAKRLAILDGVLEAAPWASKDLGRLLGLVQWHSQWDSIEKAVENVVLAFTPKNPG